MIKEKLKSEETFNHVLEILSKETGIPTSVLLDKNFIAGGSIANIINYIFHGVKPIIRDIDVFTLVEKKTKPLPNNVDIFSPALNDIRMVNQDDWYFDVYTSGLFSDVIEDEYRKTFISRSGIKTKMISQERNGLFNDVLVEYQAAFNMSDVKIDNDLVIQSFDINAVQVGLDTQKREIIFTDNFIDFMESRQLKVLVPSTPIQTIIRLISKKTDMEAYLDEECEFGLLQNSCLLHESKFVYRIGHVTYGKYLKHKNTIDKFFKIEHDENDEYWIFEPVNFIEKLKLRKDFILNPTNTLILKRFWDLIVRNKSKSEQNKIDTIINYSIDNSTVVCDSREYTSNLFKNRLKTSNFYSKMIHETVKNLDRFITVKFLLVNPNYHKCDFSLKHVRVIENFHREHSIVRFLNIMNENMTLQKHYLIIRKLKNLSKKMGLWIIGEIESINNNSLNKLKESGDIWKSLIEYLDERKKSMAAVLVEKIELSNFEYSCNVIELLTQLDLMNEGSRMGHCVGGYWGSVSDGYSRIFHIDEGGIGSTVQINTPKSYSKNKWTLSQHYGRYPEKGNLEPTINHKEIVSKLILFLNEKDLSEYTYGKIQNHLDNVYFE